MTKKEAIDYMISEIEKIEKDRIAANMSIEPNQQKNDVVAKLKNLLESVVIDNED